MKSNKSKNKSARSSSGKKGAQPRLKAQDAAKKAGAVLPKTGPEAELDKLVENIRELQASGNVKSAQAQYAIGNLVHQVQDNPQKFGQESDETAVEYLGKELGCGKDTLYNAARVYLCWKPMEFNGWLKRKSGKGAHLSFGHFTETLKLHDPNARDALLERALAEDMSTRNVREAVLAEQPAKPKARSNRLAKLLDSSERALKAWSNIDPLVGATGVDGVVLIDKLAELQQQLSVLCLENSKVLYGIRNSLLVTDLTSGPPAAVACPPSPQADDSCAERVVEEGVADPPVMPVEAGASASPVLVATNGEGTAAEAVVAPQPDQRPMLQTLAAPTTGAAARPRVRRHKITDVSNVS